MKRAGLDIPVVVLAYDDREIKLFISRNPVKPISTGFFLWQGDARILISIVKYIEDKRNVQHDTPRDGSVRCAACRRQYPLLLVVPAGDLYRDDSSSHGA